MRKWIVAGVVGAAAFIFTPFAACGPSFSFGEKEMTTAIVGTWKMTIPASGNAPQKEITMQLVQAAVPDQSSNGLIPSAHACGTRSLVKNAGACVDLTVLPLEVKFIATVPLDGETWKDIRGKFRVVGEDFRGGELVVELDKRELEAKITPMGEASESVLWRDVGQGQPTEHVDVSLVRVAK